jgi:hypothetical protein
MNRQENEQNPILGPKIPTPRDMRGRIRWTDFDQTPELRILFIEQEAREVSSQGVSLNYSDLNSAGHKHLISASKRFYPGGLKGLQLNLRSEPLKRHSGHWKDVNQIENEARDALAKGIALTQPELSRAGYGYLVSAIKKNYPDGVNGLLKKLGLKTRKQPQGYWRNVQNIEDEAKRAHDQGIEITKNQLELAGLFSLAASIRKNYPGGWRALQEKLDAKKYKLPHGFWKDPLNIESEARKAIEKGILLTNRNLTSKYPSLRYAIHHYYPGGLEALKTKLEVIYESPSAISKAQANTDLDRLLENHND